MIIGNILLIFLLFLRLCFAASFDVAAGPPLLNSPVFSLATTTDDGTNMNIVTYATPVSIRPERLWAIGLYRETLTYETFKKTGKAVLQLLTENHVPIIRLLGGSSGRDLNKGEECRKLGLEWTSLEEDQPLVLPGCKSYVCLELQGELVNGGSHDIAICRVTGMFTDTPDVPHLETQKLRDLGIITEQGRVADL